jgi:hypothetical protein
MRQQHPSHRRLFGGVLCVLLAAAVAFGTQATADRLSLGAPQVVAPGIDLFALDRADLTVDGAPQSIRLLRVDPARATLSLALAHDRIVGTETVQGIAARHGAVAAVNAGFFAMTGDPVGILRLDGQLVSDTGRPRGAMAIHDDGAATRLLFDQVTARVRLRFRVEGAWDAVPVDGVDTPGTPNRLVIFSPRFHAATGTPPGTSEWTLRGPALAPPILSTTGNTPIPDDGLVASYGGPVPPALGQFGAADLVEIRETITPLSGERLPDWTRAPHVVGGAGLLVRNGRPLTGWAPERIAETFVTTRHPRTLVGHESDGTIWLVAVDGRQPLRAAGMTFAELQWLCERIGLVDALNLDGGGSTTMVAGDRVVNRPSDVSGARPVSDAILVRPR